MENKELQQIKNRAKQVRKLLGDGSDTLQLIEDDLPRLIAEVDRLAAEAETAARCPHGSPYKERTCVECFGDGTEERRECGKCGTETWHRGGKCLSHDAGAPAPYAGLKQELAELREKSRAIQDEFLRDIGQAKKQARAMEAETEQLRGELARAGLCPHEMLYEDHACVECFGDGTEEMRECAKCGGETWYRGGRCLSHDADAPGPYETLKQEAAGLKERIRTIEEQSSNHVARTEQRVKEIEVTVSLMRDALEYVRPRIGSTNIGESLIKIDRALSSSGGGRTEENKAKKY